LRRHLDGASGDAGPFVEQLAEVTTMTLDG
jgi:hypothetical protein